MPRDLSTVLVRLGRLSLVADPRCILFGVHAGHRAVSICLVPCLPLRWERRHG